MNRKITTIVSTYNSEEFIATCLCDLTSQTIADQVEIIVIDAASPQQEGHIVKKFQAKHPNIKYIRTPERIGIYAAWNIGVRKAAGEYLTVASTNDRILPNAYETMVNVLDNRPDIALVYGDSYLTDLPHQEIGSHHPSPENNGAWQWPDYSYEYLLQNCTVGPHPMWRKKIHDEIGYFDASYRALGDQDFWLRLGAKHMLHHIPQFTGMAWITDDALSRGELAHKELIRLRKTYLLPYLKNYQELQANINFEQITYSIARLVTDSRYKEAIELFEKNIYRLKKSPQYKDLEERIQLIAKLSQK